MNKRLGCFAVCLSLPILAWGAALLSAESSGADTSDIIEQVRHNMRRLRRANIQAPGQVEASEGLDEILRKVRAVDLTARRRVSPQPTAATQPTTARARRAETQEPTKETVRQLINAEVLARLRKMAPDSVAEPVALADALFLSEHFDTASVFYNLALQRQHTPEYKARLLFQLANCRRRSDPAAARKMYGQLFNEYPNSVWGRLAQTQGDLLKWYEVNNVRTLLSEIEKEGLQSRKGPSVSTTKPSASTTKPSASSAGK